MSDDQLIEEYQSEEGILDVRELFDEIFERYHTLIAAWCYRFTHDRELALDLTQEILIKAYRRFHTFRSDAKLSTWLYSITRNHCIDAVNKRSAELIDSVDLASLRVADPLGSNAEDTLGRKQEEQRLLTIVASSLSATEARVMRLHYGDGVPINEVTSMLDLKNASGAKAYIVSARRKLSTTTRTAKYA
jgi:RNA polymerase sigma-70 factor (ECF subfamily)